MPGIVFSWAWLVVQDRECLNLREHRRGLRELFGRSGFISSLLPKMPDFLRADFHPDEHDTGALEQAWREKLFGDKGELLAQFRNREALAVV